MRYLWEEMGESKIRKGSKKGGGFINKLSNKLTGKVPEMHLLGYNACGPFTNVEERLKKGWKGINPLDEHCKQHDLFYYTNPNVDYSEIKKADKTLQEAAWMRVLSPDASKSERFWAWVVTNAMKLKTKLGMGYMSEKDLLSLLKRALEIYKKNPQLAKNILKYYEDQNHPYKTAGLMSSKTIENLGGFPWLATLPMIFAGLYYLMSSGMDIYRTVKENKFLDETLKEQIRNNKVSEGRDEGLTHVDKIRADKMMPFVHYNFDVPREETFNTPKYQPSLFKYRY